MRLELEVRGLGTGWDRDRMDTMGMAGCLPFPMVLVEPTC